MPLGSSIRPPPSPRTPPPTNTRARPPSPCRAAKRPCKLSWFAMPTSITTPTVYLPREMAHQRTVLRHEARMKVVACGRRWGKTATGLLAVLDGHGPIQADGRPLHPGAWDGGKIWWVVPDYPTAQEIWRDLKHATRHGRKD